MLLYVFIMIRGNPINFHRYFSKVTTLLTMLATYIFYEILAFVKFFINNAERLMETFKLKMTLFLIQY